MTTVLDVVFVTHEPLLEVLQHSVDSSWHHMLEGPFPIRKLEIHIVMNATCLRVQLLDKPLHSRSDALQYLQLCLDHHKQGIKGTPIFHILGGECFHHLQVVFIQVSLCKVILIRTSGPGMKPCQLVRCPDQQQTGGFPSVHQGWPFSLAALGPLTLPLTLMSSHTQGGREL